MKHKIDNTWMVWNKNNPTNCYSYAEAANKLPAILDRARKNQRDDIFTYELNAICYEKSAAFWTEQLNKAKAAEYIAGHWITFCAAQKSHLIGKIHEITEEIWDDSLNVLPPLKWETINGINQFFMSERYCGTFTDCYARHNGKYYSAMADLSDPETWLSSRLLNKND